MKSKPLLSIAIILLLFFPKLHFGQAPAIGTQPGNQIVCSGTSVSFSVAATGSALSYQWRKGNTNLTDGGNIFGSSTAILTINPANVVDASSDFNVIVSGSAGSNDTSNYAILDVNTAPGISTQPVNQIICAGDTVKFSVIATGFDLNYQWRLGMTNLVSGGNILDATAATLIIYPVTPADAATNYNVLITGGCPPNDSSVNVSLIVNPGTNITTQPGNQTVCIGSSASFSVAANGTNLTYQWMKGNTDLVNGPNISGVNTATLLINPVTVSDTASNYHVVIMGGCPPNDTSIKVSLRFDKTNIITQPSNQSLCANGPVSFSVAATGVILNYQWMKGNVILANVGNISGATTATLNINPATITDSSSFYHVIITGGCALNDTSINVSLKFNTAPNITKQPVNQTVCAGNPVSFSVAASGSALTYQWMNGNINLANGGNISGVNTATLTINHANITDTSSFYHVVITGICSPNSTSNNVSLLINVAPDITSQPVNQTVCSGNPASFSVAANGTALTYQWMNGNTNLANGGNISGVNTATLTINPATIADTSSFYHVVIKGVCPPNSTSNNVSLLINVAPKITKQPVNQTVCSGNPVSFSVAASGTALSYQWMNGNTNLANGGNISGVNTATITINPTTITDTSSFYHVVITGVCGPNSTSINVSLHINMTPGITTQPVNQTVCAGSTASFSVAASGTALSYQWMNGNVNLVNGGNISGVNTAILSINPANITDTSSFYHVFITGVCSPNSSSVNVFLHINSLPIVTANSNPSTTPICEGSSITLTGGGNATSYVWTGGVSNGISFVPSSTNTYTVTGTNATNCSNTATITINVTMLPLAVPSSNSPACIGSTINLNTPTVNGATYNWTGPNGFVSNNQNPSLSSATQAEAGTYSLTVSNNGCSSYPTIAVAVNNCAGTDLSITKTVNNAYPIIGNNVVFTLVASNKGPNNAIGVLVGDTLQSGYTYVSSTATKGTFSPATGIWNIDTLNKGTSAILSVTVKVNATGNYMNTAAIHGNAADTNLVNNTSSVETFPTSLFIPEGFSPNADGINDLFVIRGIEDYSQNTFTVFNRWGDKVFGASPYQNNWDGKSTTGLRVGGDVLPVGTYFYILDLGDGSKAFKGSIYLNK